VKKNNIWMPRYVGDYMGHTIDLTLAQHGAYLLCMFTYWRKEGPLEYEAMRSICGKEFTRVSKFFILCDGLYHHKRIDEELKRSLDKHLASIDKAKKGVQARREAGQLPPKKRTTG